MLLDVVPSPGLSATRRIRVFLARDLSTAPDRPRLEPADEEADMVVAWVPLDELVRRVLAGAVRNSLAVAGCCWPPLAPARRLELAAARLDHRRGLAADRVLGRTASRTSIRRARRGRWRPDGAACRDRRSRCHSSREGG